MRRAVAAPAPATYSLPQRIEEAAQAQSDTALSAPPASLDRPVFEVPPALPSLLPPSVIPREGTFARGTTTHPNPALEAAVAHAREQARVEGRINTQLQDGFAEARARNGLAGPHITAWGDALEAALSHTDGGSPTQLGVSDANAAAKLSYRHAVAAFGKSGDPGFAPPSQAPTHSENLARFDAPMPVRLAAQARETQLALEGSTSPLFSVTIDLEQAAGGQLLRAELLTRSGSVRFDDFVLASVPDALTRTTPPRSPIHATWKIEGWLKKDPNLVDAVGAVVSIAGPIIDQFASLDPRHAHFEYRARLLRAY